MRAVASRLLFVGLGAAGLAYLGFWLALVVERVLPRLLAFRLAGATELEWLLGPFSVVVRAPGAGIFGGTSFFSAYGVLLLLPFVLQALLLLSAWWLGRTGRASTVSAGLDFAALWTLLLLGLQVQQFAWSGRGAIGQLLLLAGNVDAQALALRLAVVVLLAAILLPAGVRFGRRLLERYASVFPLPSRPGRLAAAMWLALPFAALLYFALSAGPLFLRPTSLLGWATPYVLLAVFLFAGRRDSPRAVTQPMRAPAAGGTMTAAALAVLLYGALANAVEIRLWVADRSLAAFHSAHYTILYDPQYFDAGPIARMAAEREEVLAGLVRRLQSAHRASGDVLRNDTPERAVRIRIVLYPDAVTKRTVTRSDRSWDVRGSTIRAHVETASGELDPAADAAALLYAAYGRPGDALLARWVARWLAGTWRGEPLEAAAARILAEEGLYPLNLLLDPALDAELSPLVREPLGALWLALARAQISPNAIKTLYKTRSRSRLDRIAARLHTTAAELESRWQEHTRQLLATIPYARPPRRKPAPEAFFRGVNFTHEGFGSRRGGYDSPEAHEQLRTLRTMGVNAIAVIPYGWMRAGEERIAYTGTDETDEELALIRRRAGELGLRVLLKPQIWIGGGQFTGSLHFADAEARTRWFASYRRFLLHYARLAELEGFDVLCIGTELGGKTVYEREWRELIAEVRRVYRGPITYAANWGDEFENLAFGDALDYLGVNSYYPIASAPGASAEELRAGAERAAARIGRVARRWQKPVLLTEAGFASMRGAPVEPWRERRAAGASPEEQAAAYEATFAALEGRPWLAGIFWWKWPSHGRAAPAQSITFSLPGRPAAETISAWYRRWEAREALAAANPR